MHITNYPIITRENTEKGEKGKKDIWNVRETYFYKYPFYDL